METSVWQEYSDEGVILLGITPVNENQSTQFVIDNGLTFPILQDTPSGQGIGTGIVYDQYYIPNQGSPYPRDFIIDRNGEVVYANNEIDTEYMLAIIEELLESDASIDQNYFPNKHLITKAYPNPFNNSTTIVYIMPFDSNVKFNFYNINGQLIDNYEQNFQQKGNHQFVWKTSETLPTGIYFYNVITDKYLSKGKVILIK